MRLDINLIEEIEEITNTKYRRYYIDDEKNTLVVSNEVETILEDLIDKIRGLEKEIEYIKEDRQENYKRIPVENQYE